ncbi:hypothetical protein K461DRAFT_226725 [Myriangium duriaei CBS 260.36]|uniref:tRNA(Phe) (4-demethylwyosine(37)-C(7)) aminocarboxypropyltransferase n=1 Tax=Myriangium duriaei CBS 260.36 TaxID=1168546 RepID=A0A9P4MJQ2_9PEZI|nr:hypothetical protein K461DRAFT_226725 [Myriangium duriaei CBS 260.36]
MDSIKSCTVTLKEQNLFHATHKTKPYQNNSDEQWFAIPTNLSPDRDLTSISHSTSTSASTSNPTLTLAGATHPLRPLPASYFSRSRPPPPNPTSIIEQCFSTTLAQSPSLAPLAANLPKTYTTYTTFLLFPSSSFSPEWSPYLSSPATLVPFFQHLAERTRTTHIALNAPIPLSNSSGSNILRSPSGLVPLFGPWGPSTCSSPPTSSDFSEAYWAEAHQNGLKQVWAPRWTMFSARNVREKTRLLGLESVRRCKGQTAVDLYVGVGYFAFSYLKAGLGTVLGWDLNPWSIEGARKGSGRNGWRVEVGTEEGEGRVRLFCEGNDRARERVERMRATLPAVRHINCGLLPTSRGSWETAVGVMDKRLGGWVHVHENFGAEEVEGKTEWVRGEMEEIVRRSGEWTEGTRVTVEEVFRVKSYAPGVLHVVVDVRIDPVPGT